MSANGFQPFQSGCGVCKSSKDYADIYYSQTPTMSGAGKKRRSVKKSSTKKSSVKKSSTKKSSTKKSSVKKSSTGIRKMKKMSGGGETIQLDEDFIRTNLGIAFDTTSGGGSLPSEWFNRSKFMDGSILPGFDSKEGKLSPITGGKKVKKSTSLKKVKKSTSVKKRVSKKKTTSKKD